jgi:hypothetical protein
LIAAILLAMAAALIFGALSAKAVADAKACEVKLQAISNLEQQWNAARASNSQDAGALCTQVNALVQGYNAACQAYGVLPMLPCK